MCLEVYFSMLVNLTTVRTSVAGRVYVCCEMWKDTCRRICRHLREAELNRIVLNQFLAVAINNFSSLLKADFVFLNHAVLNPRFTLPALQFFLFFTI